jgi:hypothetical protein
VAGHEFFVAQYVLRANPDPAAFETNTAGPDAFLVGEEQGPPVGVGLPGVLRARRRVDLKRKWFGQPVSEEMRRGECRSGGSFGCPNRRYLNKSSGGLNKIFRK